MTEPAAQPGNPLQPIPVWDLPVRLFHWLLVLLLGCSWVTGEMEWMDWHFYSGYAVLVLVLFRILWGFAGSAPARFADFVRGPAAILAYLRTLPARRAGVFAGHNPLGGLSVLLILLCVLLQALTGLFANDDVLYEGPLYRHVSKALSDTLTTVHKWNFEVLLVLAAVHVAAIVYYFAWKSENLVKPMVTGRKRLPAGTARPQMASAWRALVLFLACAAAVAFVVTR